MDKSDSASQIEADPGRYRIFRWDDAPLTKDTDIQGPRRMSEHTRAFDERRWQAGSQHGSIAKLLYRQRGESPMSLLYAYLKPLEFIPRHSHTGDCLYVLIGGDISMGNVKLAVGDGFFVPSDHPYRYQAGELGCELLEFRNVRDFSTDLRDEPAEIWEQRLATIEEQSDLWESDTTPPSRRHLP